MRRSILGCLLLLLLSPRFCQAAPTNKTYTSRQYLYSVDYPATWRLKEINKVATLLAPRESEDDKFAENISIVVEDLSKMGDISLIDYHRRSSAEASRFMADFKRLEEAQTQWEGRTAIVELYTATVRGAPFKFKALKFKAGSSFYVLTYTAQLAEFDKYLPTVERIMKSIRVSP